MSIVQLRATAQALGVDFTMADPPAIIQQKIDAKVTQTFTPPPPPIEYIPEDGRMRTKPPARSVDEDTVYTFIQPFIDAGLHFEVHGDTWKMRFGKREDSGTLRMPPRVLVECAKRVMG